MATLSGVTRDATGAVLASATVNVFDASTNAFVVAGTSDASGNFSITTSSTGPFYIVAFKNSPTFVAGTSRRDLVAADTTATVQYLWTGAPTTDGVIVSAKINPTGTAGQTRLAVSTSSAMTSPVYSGYVTPDATFRVSKHTMTGLAPNTEYFYCMEVAGVLDTTVKGKFKTVPNTSAVSFSFAMGSCSENTDDRTYTAINAITPRPLFMLHMGDWRYMDKINTVEQDYHDSFDITFARPARNVVHREMPTLYMWDDHDFGNDNYTGRDASNNPTANRTPANVFFRKRVPMPQANSTAGECVYYSWKIGRLRFVVTDLRSDKTANSATDNASKTMMGATQKAWFKSEIAAAKAAGEYIAWVNTVPWVVASSTDSVLADTWASYSTERTELADYIKSQSMGSRICILSGDAHMLAIHTGADYATGGGAPIPVFHAAPLNHIASQKGGPYTYGPYPASGSAVTYQYGLVTVTDNGTTMTMNWKGLSADGTLRMEHTFDAIAPVVSAPAGAYRYIRMYITANSGDGFTSIQEMELRESAGGPDVTTPSSPVAASSNYPNEGPALAFDGNTTDATKGWTAAEGAAFPHWISVDLGTPKTLAEIAIMRNPAAYANNRGPKDFKIQGSNTGLTANDWVDIKAFTGYTSYVVGTYSTFSLAAPAPVFEATGGTVTTPGDGYKYWTFAANDTLNVTSTGNVEYLVVAGGGGGSRGNSSAGGAGGAGGVLNGTMSIPVAAHAVVIGAGGVGGNSGNAGAGSAGGNTTLGSLLTAIGGGAGAYGSVDAQSGGSGGGGPGQGSDLAGVDNGQGTAGQGNAGGLGFSDSGVQANRASGGGGGAGGVGGNASSARGGNGGAGVTVFGRAVGGGGGGASQTSANQGTATHGGGAGSYSTNATGNGTANTGGGGGGNALSGTAGTGGSGIVVIRRPV